MNIIAHNDAVRKKITENRRLAIIRLLAEDTDLSVNTSMIEDALEVFGINVSRAVVDADGAWLESVGAIRVDQVGAVTVFTLTASGLDHVNRKTIIPGIKRPSAY